MSGPTGQCPSCAGWVPLFGGVLGQHYRRRVAGNPRRCIGSGERPDQTITPSDRVQPISRGAR